MLGEFCLKVFGRLSALPVPEGRSVSPSNIHRSVSNASRLRAEPGG